jgi:hypothetical protein
LTLKDRPNRLGIHVAAAYAALVVAVFAITASASIPALGGKPSGLGYEWIPSIYVAVPWSWTDERLAFLILGFIVNAGVLYLLGTLFEKFRRRLL